MKYSQIPNLGDLIHHISLFAQLGVEFNAKELETILSETERSLQTFLQKLKQATGNELSTPAEPNDLPSIRNLRPTGPRKIWKTFNQDEYAQRLEGAMLARFAGCLLGAIVELFSVEDMENYAKETGMSFPPADYWIKAANPYAFRYNHSKREDYTRSKMNCVLTDDDIAYTLLGLLIAEEHGLDFTVADVGLAWQKYLPMACTAEDIALKNLKKGISAEKAAELDNPYCQWIGADIRSDPWGYIAPGYPEYAAELAWRDAYISHRRNGIYGAMYFAAVISAAFTVDCPMDAVKIGLSEIPADCELARAIRWAIEESANIHDYRAARSAVDAKFAGMSHIHTINNACLTVFGLSIGGTDVTKVIGETVAMGMDNDCTAATAGSIVGAVVGKAGVPEHWYKPFNNTILSYLNNVPKFEITDVLQRFTILAKQVHNTK